jgi:hypothetical protein
VQVELEWSGQGLPDALKPDYAEVLPRRFAYKVYDLLHIRDDVTRRAQPPDTAWLSYPL